MKYLLIIGIFILTLVMGTVMFKNRNIRIPNSSNNQAVSITQNPVIKVYEGGSDTQLDQDVKNLDTEMTKLDSDQNAIDSSMSETLPVFE
jgi:hypothetical protein